MIHFDEMTRVREERIEKLKGELDSTTVKLEDVEKEHGTLKIIHEKTNDEKEALMKDLKDTSEKLHVTNKVRHETEIKLAEAIEDKKGANEVVKMNNETLMRK